MTANHTGFKGEWTQSEVKRAEGTRTVYPLAGATPYAPTVQDALDEAGRLRERLQDTGRAFDAACEMLAGPGGDEAEGGTPRPEHPIAGQVGCLLVLLADCGAEVSRLEGLHRRLTRALVRP